MSTKTKNKNKKHLCRYCLQCFSCEKVFLEHKKACLKINGKQSVKLRSGAICSFTYKVVCIDDTFSKPVVLYRGKM